MKPSRNPRLHGISIAVATPFTADDRLDEDGLRRNLRWLRRTAGIAPIHFMLLGSTGEFYAVDDAEWELTIAITVEEAGKTIPVIAGAGECSTRETIRRCRRAQALGVDAVMLVNPYYISPSREGMERHIRSAASAVDCGVMLYNNETPTKIWIDPTLVRQMAEVPNLVGIKENALDIHRWHAMATACAELGLVLNCGSGEIHYAYAASAARTGLPAVSAVTSILGNFALEWTLDLYLALQTGAADAARQALQHLTRLNETLGAACVGLSPMAAIVPHHAHGVGGALFQSFIKTGNELRGLAGGRAREPMEAFPTSARVLLGQALAPLLGGC